MQLKLNNRVVNGVAVVDCGGRIVFGEESALLRDTVKKLIGENSQIVLNLAGINYIDSGGLGTLVALYTTAQNAGGSVKLANLTQRVGDLLQVTKLLTVFEVYDSEDKAVKSFGKGAAA
jgi:anti-sigma B factor antagonist